MKNDKINGVAIFTVVAVFVVSVRAMIYLIVGLNNIPSHNLQVILNSPMGIKLASSIIQLVPSYWITNKCIHSVSDHSVKTIQACYYVVALGFIILAVLSYLAPKVVLGNVIVSVVLCIYSLMQSKKTIEA